MFFPSKIANIIIHRPIEITINEKYVLQCLKPHQQLNGIPPPLKHTFHAAYGFLVLKKCI